MSYVFTAFQSPVGELKLVASDQGLMAILWANDNPNRVPLGSMKRDDANPVLIQTRLQLEQYFAGKRQRFVLPLNFVGTDFQKLVWQSLLTIPFGETRSYGQIAQHIGKPKAARAVGTANGRNPISIVIPCHRVIGSNGELTGFAGGLKAKAYLIEIENPET